jgi:hypothetical protein
MQMMASQENFTLQYNNGNLNIVVVNLCNTYELTIQYAVPTSRTNNHK